ncbi:hypothetical protein R6Q57_026147 [Mikania cordata]
MGGSSFRSSSSRSSNSRLRTSTSYYDTSYRISRSSCSTRSEVKIGLLECCIGIITIFAIWLWLGWYYADGDSVDTSVLKLQVGLSDMARSLQKDLNQIAETADTSSPKGFRYILQETILSVLQHPDHYISGYSSYLILFIYMLQVEVTKGVKECEKQFNKLSMEERVKFNEETLINYNKIRKKQSVTSHEKVFHGVSNKYIVVTIIVAASGVHELPPIKSSELLKTALQKLASIPSNNILAAEVLWTPQKDDDSLSEQEMLEDYPFLHLLLDDEQMQKTVAPLNHV